MHVLIKVLHPYVFITVLNPYMFITVLHPYVFIAVLHPYVFITVLNPYVFITVLHIHVFMTIISHIVNQSAAELSAIGNCMWLSLGLCCNEILHIEGGGGILLFLFVYHKR